MIGNDEFLMFATDYPHWDFDAPDRAIQPLRDTALYDGVASGNARRFYDFERA
jgi:predicted TIM-barrel fold metal-dependent hydrolase